MKKSIYVAIGCGIIIISIILALSNFSEIPSENILVDNQISTDSENNAGKTIEIFVEDGIGSSDQP